MRRTIIFVSVCMLCFSVVPPPAGSSSVWSVPTIHADTTWEGKVVLRENVVVAEGATLTVLPGTVVSVANGKGIGITVLGRLVATGKEGAEVRFVPENPAASRTGWEGIRLSGGNGQRHLLSALRIEGAREGVTLTDTAATISGAVFSGCETGAKGYQKSSASFDDCVFEGNGVGAALSLGAHGSFSGCRFESIVQYGVVADRGAQFAVSSCTFSRGKTGLHSLTNAPCRIEESRFHSLETGVVVRQMGSESAVSRCRFENNGTGVLAVQFCFIEIADSTFRGNQAGVEAREFSSPVVRHNRFEANRSAVSLFRKSHARVEKNVFLHNRDAVVINYSSYPRIAGNDFDRNDMSVRLERFQSGDWEARAGSPRITAAEAAKRGGMGRPEAIGALVEGGKPVTYPRRVNAKGNYWGPDAGRDPAKGTMGKIRDGRTFGPVRYEGFGETEYEIDVVDFSEESPTPVAGAGPREKPAADSEGGVAR